MTTLGCDVSSRQEKTVAEQSAQATDTRIDGATNDVATKEMAPAVETIQAFASEIAQMSGHAFVRSYEHAEKLRKAHSMASMAEAAAIQADFLKESMEHAVQHTRKYIEMLANFPHELVQPVNVAVETAEAARHAAAEKVERLSEVARRT
jgi:hypothetical protein